MKRKETGVKAFTFIKMPHLLLMAYMVVPIWSIAEDGLAKQAMTEDSKVPSQGCMAAKHCEGCNKKVRDQTV